jgi:hypothetical protein
VVLVGTRKDIVSSPADHETISTLLSTEFRSTLCWPFTIRNKYGVGVNGRTMLNFFPVDNKLGRNDPMTLHLTEATEKTMDAAPFTHKPVPLSWFKVLDVVQAESKSCISLVEFNMIANSCEIYDDKITNLLMFLNDMGMVMWHNEASLREVVIIDPISYLVTPATLVICNHIPEEEDATQHEPDTLNECSSKYRDEWRALTDFAVLDEILLTILWRDYSAHTNMLIMLMVKFGLFVPLLNRDSSKDNSNVTDTSRQFLVPALLRPVQQQYMSDIRNWTEASSIVNACVFVFSVSKSFRNNSTINMEDLKRDGFLPSGLFERVIGKAVAWSQSTSKETFHLSDALLFKDVAVLCFGRQRFRLTSYPMLGCMVVDIEGKSPISVHDRLLEQIRSVMSECMQSLDCFTALMYTSDPSGMSSYSTFLEYSCSDEFLLLPLENVRTVVDNKATINKHGGRRLLDERDIKSRYSQWLLNNDLLEAYDFFISYRWGRNDDLFVSALFDMFTNYTIGEDNRSIDVFLDKRRLQLGRRYDLDFAKALVNSTVVIPIVSVDGFEKLLTHDPAVVDNMLVEWVIVLECYNNQQSISRIRSVFPILFGRRLQCEENGTMVEKITNFFSEGYVSRLPDVVPTATLKCAADLLSSLSISVSGDFHTRKLRSWIHSLLTFLAVKTNEFSAEVLVVSAAEIAVKYLHNAQTSIHKIASENAVDVIL